MVDLEQFRKRFLTAATFGQRTFKEMEALSHGSYWRRNKRDGSKQLIEEVLPLAMVAKYLDIPGRRVRCKYLGQSDDISDGVIIIKGEWVDSGSLKPRYNIEVTTAQFEREYLMREALARYGSVFDDPDIHRTESRHRGNDQIISRARAHDYDKIVNDAICWIADAVAKKVAIDYPQPCILVIAIEPRRPLHLGEWLTIVRSFPRDVAKCKFDQTFLVHTDVGAVHRAC
jgi:hypothetical protein